MPDRKILYSPLSVTDLDGIFDYISQTLCNPQSARTIVSDILDRVENLEALPFIGSIVCGLPNNADEYRVIGVHNYLIFYRITDSAIFIDRILYKHRDYLPLLGLQE